MPEPDLDEMRALIAAVPAWHHIVELPHGLRTPGAYDPRDLWARLELTDLAGKRVLDVGTRDGFFALQCERQGAEVVAVDHSDEGLTGFPVLRRVCGLRAPYRQANVYDLDPAELGTFDVVLFLGVLYHLRHPLLALDRLRALCTGLLLVESLVCDAAVHVAYQRTRPLRALAPECVDLPLAQFLPAGRFHADATNKWVPNLAGLRALLEDSGFTPGKTLAHEERALMWATPNPDPAALRWLNLDRGLRTPRS